MPNLRKDPLLEHWVIVAAGRAQRPGALLGSPPFDPAAPCPFCEGREDQTPPETLAFRALQGPADGPGWRVRVVPNKFPALESGGPATVEGDGPSRPATDDLHLYQGMNASGGHEVIIESPRHPCGTSDLSAAELGEVFLAWRMRLACWKRDPRAVYGQLFKNVGQAAGATMEHLHSQLLVLPRVPTLVAAEMTAAADYFRRRGGCPFCHMLRAEIACGERLVAETGLHLSFAPYAARMPFETWIVPKEHASHFEEVPEEHLTDLAGIVLTVIRRLEAAVGSCAYNYVLHTTPFDTTAAAHYHWHIEIVPSLARTAGFELGSGWYINPVAPEEAARRMRGAFPSS